MSPQFKNYMKRIIKSFKKWVLTLKLKFKLKRAEKEALYLYQKTGANHYVMINHLNNPTVVSKRQIKSLQKSKSLPSNMKFRNIRGQVSLFEASQFRTEIYTKTQRAKIINQILPQL